MNKSELTAYIKSHALGLGFDKVGIARAEKLPQKHLQDWLRRKYHGQMAYMENHSDKRVDPGKLVENAKSVISVAKNYYTPFDGSDDPRVGKISRYAWGDDYHDVLRPRLKKLLTEIQAIAPETLGRCFIDTAPIMDKQWAVKAGIGWQGKHSNVISRQFGSWFFLGEIVVSTELDYDVPTANYCGTCTHCIDACPTGAIGEPYIVDASRCISYLTIELEPEFDIPTEQGKKMGNLIFGCDICQDVCPWNKKFSSPTSDPAFQPRINNMDRPLADWLKLDQDEFRSRFRKSPVKRPKFAGFTRNVTVAAKNWNQ